MTETRTTPEYCSAEELAEVYNVTVQTIRRWARSGVIPRGFRFGRRVVRWKLSEVEAALHNPKRQ